MLTRQLKYLLIISSLLYLDSATLSAQWRDLQMPKGAKKIQIPFTYENNFIIVKVTINDRLPLNFIFDTGAEHTILTQREFIEMLGLEFHNKYEYPILGADLQEILTAYLVHGVSLEMGNMKALKRNILVFEEDYFEFKEHTGLNIHGIIGADMFRRFVVEIDYRNLQITLHDPRQFKKPKSKYRELDIEIDDSKPYLMTDIVLGAGRHLSLKMLMDSGANLAVLLHTNSDPRLEVPDHTIHTHLGMGLGGAIKGYMGRVESVALNEDLVLEGVKTNFQDILDFQDTLVLNNRNGIIGNEVLSRFNLLIDYIRETAYLAPNRRWKRKFRVDRSGIFLSAAGQSQNKGLLIHFVSPGTPAYEAGLRSGDRILKINGMPTSIMGLERAMRKFQKRAGKKMHLVIVRNKERKNYTFRLRDLI